MTLLFYRRGAEDAEERREGKTGISNPALISFKPLRPSASSAPLRLNPNADV